MEEKLCTTSEILKKLEAELRVKTNGSNTSFDSSASSTSPGARRSVDRDFNQPRVKSLFFIITWEYLCLLLSYT